ncbi:unnamed protein product [Hymenolepis diminuta]|nr:unnamed protein product [Hymenolepis diminuta]
MSSPIMQFQMIPKDQCVPGASWEGPDIHYNLICSSLRLQRSTMVILFTFAFLLYERLNY